MQTISQMVQDLRLARSERQADLRRVDAALAALNSASTNHNRRASQTSSKTSGSIPARKSHKLSAAGRARIAAAQKLRWAKMRAKQKKRA